MCDPEGKCCFFINLRAGVITIACIFLIGDSTLLAYMSFVTYIYGGVSMQYMVPESPWDIIVTGPFWLSVVYDVLFSLAVLLDIVLLVGAIKGRRRLLRVWTRAYLVVYIITLLVSSLIIIFAFICGPSVGFPVAAGFLAHLGLTVYFMMVVHDYYHELGQQNGEGEPLSTAAKV